MWWWKKSSRGLEKIWIRIFRKSLKKTIRRIIQGNKQYRRNQRKNLNSNFYIRANFSISFRRNSHKCSQRHRPVFKDWSFFWIKWKKSFNWNWKNNLLTICWRGTWGLCLDKLAQETLRSSRINYGVLRLLKFETIFRTERIQSKSQPWYPWQNTFQWNWIFKW